MISNYIKLAIRVLGRNKFFTAISLFGISFTLAILMLIVSVLETEVGRTPPLTEKDKMVLLPNLQYFQQFYDTIYVYDTVMTNGDLVIDTTFNLNEAGTSNSNSEYALWYLEEHFSNVPNAVEYTFFNANNSFNAYVNNSKVEMKAVYTDHSFWDVFDFVFIEGFGFDKSSVDQGEPVAVITTELADKYFGVESGVLGEDIIMDGRAYKVMGIVKPAGVSLLAIDIIVPHSLQPIPGRRDESGFGGFMAVFKGDNASAVSLIKDDIELINSGLEIPPNLQDDFNEVSTQSFSFYEAYADQLLDLDDSEKSLQVMRWIMIGLISLFILLPTLNLINLNVSRILERSSEIGVRKAFGASQGELLVQFVVENVIQTLIGGVIGLGLAMLFMNVINEAKLMGDIILKINFRFFIYSLILCLVFGVASGLLPAFRMSKLHVVSALKSK